MSVRDIEVRLTGTEDNILNRLGYREYSITIGTTEVEIKPEVVMKSVSSFGADQLQQFTNQLGNYGNPVAFFKVSLSRLVPESLVRSLARWYVSRDGYSSECLPVSIEVDDSRYNLVLAILKQEGTV